MSTGYKKAMKRKHIMKIKNIIHISIIHSIQFNLSVWHLLQYIVSRCFTEPKSPSKHNGKTPF